LILLLQVELLLHSTCDRPQVTRAVESKRNKMVSTEGEVNEVNELPGESPELIFASVAPRQSYVLGLVSAVRLRGFVVKVIAAVLAERTRLLVS
jgi:hypothetical protein